MKLLVKYQSKKEPNKIIEIQSFHELKDFISNTGIPTFKYNINGGNRLDELILCDLYDSRN